MNLDAELLAIIVCPACHGSLEPRPGDATREAAAEASKEASKETGAETAGTASSDELVCQGCGLAYPVRDDIPILLVDEARKPS